MNPKVLKKVTNNVLLYILFAFVLLTIVFPFLWQLMTSFKSPDEMWLIPPTWIPQKFNLSYYKAVIFERPFLIYLKNSLIIAGCSTLSCIVFTAPAAYAIARLKFVGQKILPSFVLTISMFPAIAIISALYLVMRQLSLLNSYLGIILVYTTITIPLSLWNLISFFRTIPKEMEESAKVDGASTFYCFLRIILPLAKPGIFTVSILVFISAWNEFIYALTFNTKDTMRTVTVGISLFAGEFTLPWGDMAAASVIVTVPLIIMVLIFQNRIVSGITAGAVKG